MVSTLAAWVLVTNHCRGTKNNDNHADEKLTPLTYDLLQHVHHTGQKEPQGPRSKAQPPTLSPLNSLSKRVEGQTTGVKEYLQVARGMRAVPLAERKHKRMLISSSAHEVHRGSVLFLCLSTEACDDVCRQRHLQQNTYKNSTE
jgi:hypothetical protein